jgi:hypothetical protein
MVYLPSGDTRTATREVETFQGSIDAPVDGVYDLSIKGNEKSIGSLHDCASGDVLFFATGATANRRDDPKGPSIEITVALRGGRQILGTGSVSSAPPANLDITLARAAGSVGTNGCDSTHPPELVDETTSGVFLSPRAPAMPVLSKNIRVASRRDAMANEDGATLDVCTGGCGTSCRTVEPGTMITLEPDTTYALLARTAQDRGNAPTRGSSSTSSDS